MTITYKDKELELKYSFRAMMMQENITQKSFALSSYTDIIAFFYAVILASNKDVTIDFDEFIDWLDENPMEMEKFSEWITDNIKMQDKLSPKEEQTTNEAPQKRVRPAKSKN